MKSHDYRNGGEGGVGAAVSPPLDDVRSALACYQVLFERAAFMAQIADDERLHEMLDTLELFALVTDVNGDVTYMNTAMLDRLGRTLDEVVGPGFADITSVHDELKSSIVAAISSGQLAAEWVTEVPLTGDTKVTVRWTSTFIRDDHGRISGLTSVGEDITELESEDAQLTERIRRENVGRLAGGIAHDFNNFLTVIGGHAHLARSAPTWSGGAQPHLDQIDVAVQRATELVTQLLAFGRHAVTEPAAISVSDALGDLAALMRPTFRTSITIEVVTATNHDLVQFDRCRLDQIFINLAFNSRDAMPDGGTLTFSVTDQHLDQENAEALGVEAGPYVVVTVTDDGVGIEADVIDHLFKRHFTTKPIGKGTGLGLSTVHDVITKAGGAIIVETDRETGAEFTLYLRRDTSQSG